MPRFLSRVLLLLVGFTPAPLGFAQEQEVRTIPYEGPEFFCHILHNEGVRPIAKMEDALADPRRKLIIVFGRPDLLQDNALLANRLKEFVDAGGNLFVATDYRLTLPEFSVRFDDRKVKQDRRRAYHQIEDCPKLTPPGLIGLGPTHPLFHFLGKGIVANRPGFLWPGADNALEPMLSFPAGVRVDVPEAEPINLGGFRFQRPRFLPQAKHYIVASKTDAPADGRMLFIAGHGMFINGVMAQRDNDNFDFAVNAVRWMSEQTEGPDRRDALFVLDGRIVTDFDMNLTPPPPPIPMPTVKMLNRLVRGLEDERFFHRALAGLLGENLGRFVAIVFMLVSFGVLIYGSKKLMEGRSPAETPAPSVVGAVPAADPAAPIEERTQARLRKHDFAAEAKQLALDWLHAEFGVTCERWRPGVQAEFAVRGFFWSAWRLRGQADWVLGLARDGAGAFSRHQFFVLVEALRDLSEAVHDDRLALLVEGKNVRQD